MLEWSEQSEIGYDHDGVPSEKKVQVWAKFVDLPPRKVPTEAGQGAATGMRKPYS